MTRKTVATRRWIEATEVVVGKRDGVIGVAVGEVGEPEFVGKTQTGDVEHLGVLGDESKVQELGRDPEDQRPPGGGGPFAFELVDGVLQGNAFDGVRYKIEARDDGERCVDTDVKKGLRDDILRCGTEEFIEAKIHQLAGTAVICSAKHREAQGSSVIVAVGRLDKNLTTGIRRRQDHRRRRPGHDERPRRRHRRVPTQGVHRGRALSSQPRLPALNCSQLSTLGSQLLSALGSHEPLQERSSGVIKDFLCLPRT